MLQPAPAHDFPRPLLWLDASGPTLAVAFAVEGRNPVLLQATGRAGDELFPLLAELEASTGRAAVAAAAYLMCRGPGSQLGLRTAALALATWRTLPRPQSVPLWSVLATDLLALQVRSSGFTGSFTIAVPKGRLAWACARFEAVPVSGELPELVPASEIERLEGPVFFPHGVKLWAPTPASFEPLPDRPDLRLHFALSGSAAHRADAHPVVWPDEPAAFRKWSPS